jgi:hypothetical protein
LQAHDVIPFSLYDEGNICGTAFLSSQKAGRTSMDEADCRHGTLASAFRFFGEEPGGGGFQRNS